MALVCKLDTRCTEPAGDAAGAAPAARAARRSRLRVEPRAEQLLTRSMPA